MEYAAPKEIAEYADEVCLLFGITGQNTASMRKDIKTGLTYFQRICINLMTENTSPVKPDKRVINAFMQDIYPQYRENERVDILLENTEFGVGGGTDE